MNPPPDIRVIINPASASRRTLRRIPAIIDAFERRLPGRCAFTVTERPGDAHRLAAQAVLDSCSRIVAVGGDGTVNEAVNGMMSAVNGRVPPPALGVITSGSGQGFALSLHIPGALDEQVRLIAQSPSGMIDIGSVSAQGPHGERCSRYFVNECQIGIGADVVRRAGGAAKSAGGLIGYGIATLISIFRSPNAELSLVLDDCELPRSNVLGLAVGNGALTAGGMALTPGARPDDGVLNLLTIDGLPLSRRLRSFPRIYTGAHIGTRGFSYRVMKQCSVSGLVPLPVAADGEMTGVLPCTIAIHEGALRVIAPVQFWDDANESTEYRFAQARV